MMRQPYRFHWFRALTRAEFLAAALFSVAALGEDPRQVPLHTGPSSSEVAGLLEDLKEAVHRPPSEIQSIDSDFQAGSDSAAYAGLNRMGANALPEMATALQSPQDPRYLSCLVSLCWRAALCNEYRFSRFSTEAKVGREFLDDPANVPVVSFEIASKQGKYPQFVPTEQDRKALFLRWWNHRREFLSRPHVLDRIRRATGRTPEAYARYDVTMFRKLEKEVLTWGIYAIPYYLDAISADNNSVIMMLFMKGQGLPPANTHCWRWTYEEEVLPVEKAYPTREDKLRVICEWWAAKKHTYTRLEDLYAAVDTRVQKMEAELEEAEAASPTLPDSGEAAVGSGQATERPQFIPTP